MTLDDLSNIILDLIEEHGGDEEILLYNALTDDMEEIEVSPVAEFDPDSDHPGDYLVVHSIDTVIEPKVYGDDANDDED